MNVHSLLISTVSIVARLSDFYLVDKNITANSGKMVILNDVFLIKRQPRYPDTMRKMTSISTKCDMMKFY